MMPTDIYQKALARWPSHPHRRFTGRTVTLGARVPRELARAIEYVAEERGVLVSDVLRVAFFEYIERRYAEVQRA